MVIVLESPIWAHLKGKVWPFLFESSGERIFLNTKPSSCASACEIATCEDGFRVAPSLWTPGASPVAGLAGEACRGRVFFCTGPENS